MKAVRRYGGTAVGEPKEDSRVAVRRYGGTAVGEPKEDSRAASQPDLDPESSMGRSRKAGGWEGGKAGSEAPVERRGHPSLRAASQPEPTPGLRAGRSLPVLEDGKGALAVRGEAPPAFPPSRPPAAVPTAVPPYRRTAVVPPAFPRGTVPRGPRVVPTGPNHVWAMDFVHDTLADGRAIRVLTLIDSCTRECLTLTVAPRFTGADVARIVGAVGAACGLPQRIAVDNGTEFTSKAFDAWAYWNHVQLDFSRPGKPVDNCLIEAFNGSLRRECLSQHWFASPHEAQQILSQWREDYNNVRPHTSFAHRSPAMLTQGGHYIPGPNRLPNCDF